MSLNNKKKVEMETAPNDKEIPIVLGNSFFVNDPERASTYLHFKCMHYNDYIFDPYTVF